MTKSPAAIGWMTQVDLARVTVRAHDEAEFGHAEVFAMDTAQVVGELRAACLTSGVADVMGDGS